jgi:proliferating cell nuclear antigen
MFEARIAQAKILRKIIEAIKELVTDVILDCNDDGITMKAMDSSHVSFCYLNLPAEGFDYYRCDKNISLGINTINLAKILKCADNEDLLTLKSVEDADILEMVFKSSEQKCLLEFEVPLVTSFFLP